MFQNSVITDAGLNNPFCSASSSMLSDNYVRLDNLFISTRNGQNGANTA